MEILIILSNDSDNAASVSLEARMSYFKARTDSLFESAEGSDPQDIEVPAHTDVRYRHKSGWVLDEARMAQVVAGKSLVTLHCEALYAGNARPLKAELFRCYDRNRKDFIDCPKR